MRAIAALCGLLLLAGCGSSSDTPDARAAVTGFQVHATESGAPAPVVQAAPQRRTPGCVEVRQGDAKGPRNCLPKKQVCARGAVWWTKSLTKICGPAQPEAITIVSAPEELPVGSALCLVWVGTPSKVREGVLVVSSAHANCVTGIVGTVAAPPADPLSLAFPTKRPDCGQYYPGTRRAWPARVTFTTEPPSENWACLVG